MTIVFSFAPGPQPFFLKSELIGKRQTAVTIRPIKTTAAGGVRSWEPGQAP